ncbi:hypothetical protein KC315_g8068 [Hortaea werneckii]|uniref:Mitochondrial phosphate carrier protein n=1 Tax=Hortaea werneckii TaxID=91943 RepID=A0A3M7CZK2_HORWE|nr:hypothetical protein KC315_g8068 [Hortaea werneckii]RMY57383.1 hypothetical protein D0865_03142 [Hortaea werneckii]
MPSLFPSASTLSATFGHAAPHVPQENKQQPASAKRSPYLARTELYGSWSVSEDAQKKTQELGDAAAKEFSKASEAAQANVGKIELYSAKYYATCTFGGLMACGATHWGVTPLDLVKCRRQVDSKLYTSNMQGWRTIMAQDGFRGIYTGGAPTFFGYSVQGALKYGCYEFFKKFYSDLAGPENAVAYKTWIYLAGSASAEFFADIGLCPFEAVKVRMQTTMPPFAKGTWDGMSKIVSSEGIGGLYKGLYPLWGRQIPYTMMKFASFETIVEMMYARLPGEKSDYSKGAQTGVAFTSGYLAGILCAIVSHPADVMVSKLNTNRKAGEGFGAAMGRIYKDIGFSGLWSGLPVRIVMIGTLTGLQWMVYDSFKIFMGLPTTGGQTPPPEKK